MEEWLKKLQENAEINSRNQSAFVKNLETQIEQLVKEFHTKAANDISSSSLYQCKAMYAKEKTPINDRQHEISLVYHKCTQIVQENVASAKVLPYLGASVNVIPKSMFEHLKLDRLKKTDMLIEMADMTKRSPIGKVENVLVKIDKFLFPSDFVVIDMLNIRNETMILGRPFLATIHAKIDVCNKEISLGIREEEEIRKLRIDIKEYDPPMVHVETFEVKKYPFDTSQNFICVTKDLMDALPLGRENGSRFRDMIRKEVDSRRRIRRKT
ncbi:reverse transcriptase domain-containing protein [Tanacetum coccineum]